MHYIYTTNKSEDTEALGAAIAKQLRGGEVIELVSDLGGGKTTFTRGLAAGLGVTDAVASPTFTLSREYGGGRLRMYHYDFYRLDDAGVLADDLAEVVGDPEGVVVVEWADVVQHVLPEELFRIDIRVTGETSREIGLTVSDSVAYLLEGVA